MSCYHTMARYSTFLTARAAVLLRSVHAMTLSTSRSCKAGIYTHLSSSPFQPRFGRYAVANVSPYFSTIFRLGTYLQAYNNCPCEKGNRTMAAHFARGRDQFQMPRLFLTSGISRACFLCCFFAVVSSEPWIVGVLLIIVRTTSSCGGHSEPSLHS